MGRKLCLFFFVFAFLFVDGKQPQLSPRDVKSKMEEILKAHVCHKSLTVGLLERVFQNFIEEIDPMKTYFLEKEIDTWLHPTEETLQAALKGYKTGDFS